MFRLELYGSAYVAFGGLCFFVGMIVGVFWAVNWATDILKNPGSAVMHFHSTDERSDFVIIRYYDKGRCYQAFGAGDNGHINPKDIDSYK